MSEEILSYDEVSKLLKNIIKEIPNLCDGVNRAVVFDIDETLLTMKNLLNRIKKKSDIFRLLHYPIFAGIPEMIELHNWIRKLNISTFLITGRKSSTESSTIENLSKVGVNDYSGIYFKPSTKETSEEYKTRTRKLITEEGYTIIANIGDLIADLAGEYSEYRFLLPSTY